MHVKLSQRRGCLVSLASVPPKKADEGKDKDKDKDAAEAALSQEARLANAVRDTKARARTHYLYIFAQDAYLCCCSSDLGNM